MIFLLLSIRWLSNFNKTKAADKQYKKHGEILIKKSFLIMKRYIMSQKNKDKGYALLKRTMRRKTFKAWKNTFTKLKTKATITQKGNKLKGRRIKRTFYNAWKNRVLLIKSVSAKVN